MNHRTYRKPLVLPSDEPEFCRLPSDHYEGLADTRSKRIVLDSDLPMRPLPSDLPDGEDDSDA
jgi:hypothetical protein